MNFDLLRVCGPKDAPSDEDMVLNVTTGGKTWVRHFSPMLLGPVKLYGPYGAWNVENAWQFSKVYKEYASSDGEPTESYWEWAENGWADERAQRYPNGKGAKPLYSWWNGAKLDYISARKKIYIPLYQEAVAQSGFFEALVGFVEDCLRSGQRVWIFDYDGYDHKALGMTYEDVLNNHRRKMGHGFVLAAMLEEALEDEAAL